MKINRTFLIDLLGFNKIKSYCWLVLALLSLQQVIVASSSYFLIKFLDAVQAQEKWQSQLTLLLASVVLPYLPGFLAIYCTQLWIQSGLDRLWQKSISSVQGQIGELFNLERKADFAIQVKEMGNLIEETCKYLLGFYPSVLNCLLNGLVIARLLGNEFLGAFLIGFLISSCQFFFTQKYGKGLSSQKQSLLAIVDSHILQCWQTLVVENYPLIEKFKASFVKAKTHYFSSGINLSKFENSTSLLLLALSFTPTILVTLNIAYSEKTTTADLIALAALLPRIFQLFTVASNVLLGLQQGFNIYGKWTSVIYRFSTQIGGNGIESRIKTERLTLQDSITLEKVPLNVNVGARGRLCLTGLNGAGKTSWMLKSKRDLGAKAFYLPAKFEEFPPALVSPGMSTGQKKMLELQFLSANKEQYDTIFLDEWDANLDFEAKSKAGQLISEIAKQCLVIESRH